MDLGFSGNFTFLGGHYAERPFEIIWANEINPAACRTYRRNIGGHVREGDIWKLLDELPEYADVVIGGFPCQDISVNGLGAGIEGKRSGLYRAMVDAVRRTLPRVFVAENVKGLLSQKHASDLRQILSDFAELGYNVTYHLYDASDYGVPQTRERVFIIGTRLGAPLFTPPPVTHASGERVTAEHALRDLEHLVEDDSINHIWSRAARSPEQGNRRLVADRPGYTIRSECHGNIQWHYALPRRISMREAARIQSFPDSFIFDAKLRETERQVGNAVPPILAWHVAGAVAEALRAPTNREQKGRVTPPPT
jgi:DNA (cytosine-5)-methyltransferase 1